MNKVVVSNLHLGATVRIYQDGFPIGLGWAGLDSTITIDAAPGLVAGKSVTARQRVGLLDSLFSEPVEVLPARELLPPRIMTPVAVGDTTVWVSRVVPGAHIAIMHGSEVLGEVDTAESIVRVPVRPVPGSGTIFARIRICDEIGNGTAVEPITSPCARGDRPEITQETKELGSYDVPNTPDGMPLTLEIVGELYYPSHQEGLPLVIIVHGLFRHEEWPEEVLAPIDIESYKGYHYLARHLASWRMAVYSVNLNPINQLTVSSTYLYSRAEVILETIQRLLDDSEIGRLLDPTSIGVIGHSMGGDAAVVAQHLNADDVRGYNIKGVVSIAPTYYRSEAKMRDAHYLQLLGSRDQLVSRLSKVVGPHDPVSSGFRHYDNAQRNKTHAWIYGARHNPFNPIWVEKGDDFETHLVGADGVIDDIAHQTIAKCMINAFFLNALRGLTIYEGYMEGTILPQSIRAYEIHVQHSREPRTVVDNFGDADAQQGLVDSGLSTTTTSQGLTAAVDDGGGLGIWNDIEHITTTNSPHDTKGVELSWDAPNVIYISPSIAVPLTGTDVVALRIAQFFEDAALNPLGTSLDSYVTVIDGSTEVSVRLGAIAKVPFPDSAPAVLSVMRTMRIPLDAFEAVNPTLSMGSIVGVKLRLVSRLTGHVLVDDIELGA